MIDFDTRIDRTCTDDIKWVEMYKNYGTDMIPMWIADMDLPIAQSIIDKIQERLKTPIFGYADFIRSDFELIAKWYNDRHNYGLEPEDIRLCAGVVFALSIAIQQFTKPNDKVLIMTPAYKPFVSKTLGNDRIPVYTELKYTNGRFEIDFEEMETVCDKDVKMMILCNPQNPTGRVFDKEELVKLADFAQRHELMVLSDEIHCDIDFSNKFVPFYSVSDYARMNTLSLTACTKTFNLAGTKFSYYFSKNKEILEKMEKGVNLVGLAEINTFAQAALRGAYSEEGYAWYKECMAYLKGNIDYAVDRLNKIDGVTAYMPESTYLIWVKFDGVEDLHQKMLTKAKVQMNAGTFFGDAYTNYERMNVACPRSQVKEAIDRIEKMMKELKHE